MIYYLQDGKVELLNGELRIGVLYDLVEPDGERHDDVVSASWQVE